jgi:hypothetical protein
MRICPSPRLLPRISLCLLLTSFATAQNTALDQVLTQVERKATEVKE